MPCNRLLLIDSDSISYQFTRNENYAWIKNVSSLTQYPASKFNSTKLCRISCTFGQTLDATEFSSAVSGFGQSSEVKYFSHRSWKVFRFFAFFPREIKVSVQSLNMVCKLTNQCSCPGSVHVLCISMEFLPANWRCELKAKMACGVGKLI